MKKKFLLILLCSGLLLNLVGCNKTETGVASDINSTNIEEITSEETTTEPEELTDLPFDNSKPEYVVAYLVNKLANADINNSETLYTNDILLPSKFVTSMSNSIEEFSYIVERLAEDKQNTGIDNYSYDNFVINLHTTAKESSNNTYIYQVICNIEESRFLFEIGITEADEENNHFVGYYSMHDEGEMKSLLTITETIIFGVGTSGGTKADLIKKWEDDGTLVNVSLKDFM